MHTTPYVHKVYAMGCRLRACLRSCLLGVGVIVPADANPKCILRGLMMFFGRFFRLCAIVHPEGVVHLRLLRHESEFVRHESGFDPTNSRGTQQRPGTSRFRWAKRPAAYSCVSFQMYGSRRLAVHDRATGSQ